MINMPPPAGHKEAGPHWSTDEERVETLSFSLKSAVKRRRGPGDLNTLAEELAETAGREHKR